MSAVPHSNQSFNERMLFFIEAVELINEKTTMAPNQRPLFFFATLDGIRI